MPRKITHKEAAAVYLKADFDLLQQYVDSGTAHRCLCRRCGSKCTASYTSVRQGQRGCKKCKAELMRNARILDSEEVDKLFRDSGMEPLEPYLGASKPRKSRCLTCGKIGTPTYTTLRTGHLGCKDCGYKIVKSKQISLKRDLKKIERIFREANLEPLDEFTGANNPRRCRCLNCKKIVSPRYGSLQQGQGGCIYCGAKLRGENQRTSQETADAVCASKNITPLEPFISVDTPRACRCNVCGKTSKSRLKELVRGRASGCRFCGYKNAGLAKRIGQDLVDLVFYERNLKPKEPYRGANIPRLCECLICGTLVKPQYASLKSGQGGCLNCGYKNGGKKNAMPESIALKILTRVKLKPLEAYPGRDKPWRCIHTSCGREVKPSIASISSGRGGCISCGRETTSSKQRTPQTVAISIMESAGFKPLAKYESRVKPWKSIHKKCGYEVAPTLANIAKGGGCKYCVETGIDYKSPGILYLMKHNEFQAIKVGISSTKARKLRVPTHTRNGWELIQQWDLDTADIALTVETIIINKWRNELGAPPALLPKDMPQGGASETAALLHVDIDDTTVYIDQLVSELGNS
jgi:recombinational DNA repair protein (RecF pathway)